jgi:hypothetical protein
MHWITPLTLRSQLITRYAENYIFKLKMLPTGSCQDDHSKLPANMSGSPVLLRITFPATRMHRLNAGLNALKRIIS